MSTILVTGGTGDLGRPTVDLLRRHGHDVRVLSRRPGSGHVVGDLDRDEHLESAVEGADAVIHLASNARKDLPATERLLALSRAAGIRHFVYISIVGVDRIPYFYYRDKLANERAIERSGVPHSILRATQFHSFPARLLDLQSRLPFLLGLDLPIQPIAEAEVAQRLVELVEAEPVGRAADIGGPEIRRSRDLLERIRVARGDRRRIRYIQLPGATFRAFRDGHHLTGLPGYGRQTFGEWLEANREPVR